MTHKLTFLFALAWCAISAVMPAYAISEERPAAELIHSDLPLFGDETSDKWPQHFSDPKSREFGCVSRVSFGDWILREVSKEMDAHPSWYRVQNYGVIHCWAMVGTAGDEPEELDRVVMKPSFFVLMETVGSVELWALQIGGRPGSDYMLLSRKADPGKVSSFSVLQRECPKGNPRKGPAMDIIRTDYCAINSAAELRQLARRMLKKKPLGTLTFVNKPNKE